MRRLVRSTAFRIALVFALALTATTYGVFAIVYVAFHRANVAFAETVLTAEVRGSLDAPIDRLETRLRLRLTQDLRRLDYVGLYDKSGRPIIGSDAPLLDVPRDGKAHEVRLPPPGQQASESREPNQQAIVVGATLPDGGTIVLGRSLAAVDELANAMLRAFAIAIVPVVLLALVVGTLVSMRASRRLTAIQQAISRVMQGELAVRLPARGTPDDIDALVGAVNLMLDEIVRLLSQLKRFFGVNPP